LRLMLGAKIRQIESRGLREHTLREQAAVATGGRNRTDEMKAACRGILRKIERIAGPEHVGADEIRVGCAQVIERTEMEEVLDATGQRAPLRRRYAEQRLTQVAMDRHQQFSQRTAIPHQLIEFGG